MMSLIDRLPRSEIDAFEGMIQLPDENTAASEQWMRDFYGKELMESELPLSDEDFNNIYNMSTDGWKEVWKVWKEQGILS